jgi:hypothetical protein
MQWRSAWIRVAAAPALVAALVTGCNESDTVGPRIATIRVVSGNNQPGAIGAQLALPVVIEVVDQRGQPVEGAQVTFAASSGGVMTPAVGVTDENGLTSSNWRLGAALGVQTATATLAGVAPVSLVANAATAPASKLTVEEGDGQTAQVGQALAKDLEVFVADAFDNPVPNVPVSFTVVSGGGVVSSATTTSDPNGIARVSWTLGTAAGTQTLVAGSGSVTPVTFTATATSADPTQFIILSGNNQIAQPGTGLPDSIVVRLADQYGNGVPGATVQWAVPNGGGVVSPSTTITNGTGRTAVKWTLGGTGGPTIMTISSNLVQTTVTGAGFIQFAVVNAGGQSSCGIDTGGVLYCWGSNNDGQLGVGVGPAGSGPIFAAPQAIPPIGNQTFGQVNGGLYHNCAVTTSHVGYCWGNNNSGQLGDGTDERMRSEPTLVKEPTAPHLVKLPFATISAGRIHSCGVTTGGRPFCWGSNDRGQLGRPIAALPDSKEPIEVGQDASSFDFKAIAAGGNHTCAVSFAGQAFCWGLGREGELGNGTNDVNNFVPQLVLGGASVDSITAGFGHSCALTTSGAAICWGTNTEGQLGDGGNNNATSPAAVSGGQTFVAISAGYSHTCALTAGGAAYCWGRNAEGQLGTGSTAAANTPQLVQGGLTFRSISAGDYSTCGVTTSNVAYCWGDNEFGTVGDGSTTNRTIPAKVKFQP